MFRPFGTFLMSLPVALVLAVPAAQAQSSAAAQNGSLPDLFGLFHRDRQAEVRQAQAQPSMSGSSQIQSEGLPPPGLAPSDVPSSNGLPAAIGNGNGSTPAPVGGQFGHQFGSQAAQPDANSVAVARPPAAVGGPSSAPAAVPNETVMALPPDDQPEQGQPKELPPNLKRQLVDYQTKEPAGTIIVDTAHTYLYLVLGGGKALRYGVRVGREGFTWTGTERITRMAEWPDWHPPTEMIERQPYLPRFMAGGPGNPLGARAMYLGKTLYRIHGTNQPSTIGHYVSSGCVGMLNDDVEDLFSRVQVGTRVVVLPGSPPPSETVAQGPQSPANPMAPPASAAPAPVNPPVMAQPKPVTR
ncbi:MAG: L,D-transpeptidase family protein [Proteobacteria bacterium]|nr:L,D-transpeptidase family protein [Pseudomonadota bacterium]